MEKKKRNYRKEYDNYHASPEQRQRNAARLRARRLMVKKGKVKVFSCFLTFWICFHSCIGIFHNVI